MKGPIARFTTTIAAAAALGATAVPALALENEFHGMFRVRGIISNLDDYRSAYFDATDSSGIAKPLRNPGTRSFIEQRARLLYIAKANDDLKLHTHFEIDSRWGDAAYNDGGRGKGGAIGADSVNLETKNVYLDFNIPSTPLNVKVGIQPFADSLKGVFINADAAGALATARFGPGEAAVGYFRFNDTLPAGSTVPGKATRDFFVVDGKYSLSKDTRVGASYYGVLDDRAAGYKNQIHTIGVNGATTLGPATIDGFLAYQTGEVGSSEQDLQAFAANVGAKVKAGIGTARANFLYISGDGNPGSGTRNDFQTIGSPGPEHGFSVSEMLLLLPHKTSLNTYRGIIWDLNNRNQGVIGGFIGYDATLTDKLFASANAGFAATAKNNGNKPSGSSGSQYLGTEISSEVGYKLFPNLTASVQGGYVFLGDYFKGTAVDAPGKDPEDPYTARIVLSFLF